MQANSQLRLVAIALGMAALVLVVVALMFAPGTSPFVLVLVGISAVLTIGAMFLAGRRRRR